MKHTLRAVIASALVLMAAPALATWQGFYTPSERPSDGGFEVPEASVCVREIFKAQLRHGIPDNLLLGIGLQESGLNHEGELTVWPWSVNAAGEGRVFASRESAMSWVEKKQREGVNSIDVGCMQVNLRWHKDAFATLEEGFDPAANVDYAARLLRDLYSQSGDWVTAAGSYHSFTPQYRDIYIASLKQNVVAANARIDDFRALAGSARMRDDLPREKPEAQGGIFWSSGLSQLKQGESGVRSIYSDRALQPVLPVFLVGAD